MKRIIIALAAVAILAGCETYMEEEVARPSDYRTPEEHEAMVRERVKAEASRQRRLEQRAKEERVKERDRASKAAQIVKLGEERNARIKKREAEIKATSAKQFVDAAVAERVCVEGVYAGLKKSNTRDLNIWRALPGQVCSFELERLALAFLSVDKPHIVARPDGAAFNPWIKAYREDVARQAAREASVAFSDWLNEGAPS